MSTKFDGVKQNRIIKRNAIASIVCKGMEYFLAFFTTPVLLYILGEYKYGVFTTALSIISWMYYFDFGIGSGMRNSVAEAIAIDEYDTARKCISVAYVLVSCIAIVAFIAVKVLSFAFDFEKLLNARLLDENLNTIIVTAFFLACMLQNKECMAYPGNNDESIELEKKIREDRNRDNDSLQGENADDTETVAQDTMERKLIPPIPVHQITTRVHSPVRRIRIRAHSPAHQDHPPMTVRHRPQHRPRILLLQMTAVIAEIAGMERILISRMIMSK